MAYFSTGTEGLDYHEHYCSRCVHDKNEDCPVWGAHLMYAYSCSADARAILDRLIPRSKDGVNNEECRLFVHDHPRLPGM